MHAYSVETLANYGVAIVAHAIHSKPAAVALTIYTIALSRNVIVNSIYRRHANSPHNRQDFMNFVSD
jgi:hypothetical protein